LGKGLLIFPQSPVLRKLTSVSYDLNEWRSWRRFLHCQRDHRAECWVIAAPGNSLEKLLASGNGSEAKKTVETACRRAIQALATNTTFRLRCCIESGGTKPLLVETAGIEAETSGNARERGFNTTMTDGDWDEFIRAGQAIVVDDLTTRFGVCSGPGIHLRCCLDPLTPAGQNRNR